VKTVTTNKMDKMQVTQTFFDLQH